MLGRGPQNGPQNSPPGAPVGWADTGVVKRTSWVAGGREAAPGFLKTRLGFLRGGARPPLASLIALRRPAPGAVRGRADLHRSSPRPAPRSPRAPTTRPRRRPPVEAGGRATRRSMARITALYRGELPGVRGPQDVEGAERQTRRAAARRWPAVRRGSGWMQALGLHGRGRRGPQASRTTTIPAEPTTRPEDALNRDFTAPAPEPPLGRRHHLRRPPGPGSCTSRSSWTCSPAAIVGWRASHLAAHRPRPGRPRAGHLAARQREGRTTSPGWSTTPTAASSTSSIRYTERLVEPGITASVGSSRRLLRGIR